MLVPGQRTSKRMTVVYSTFDYEDTLYNMVKLVESIFRTLVLAPASE